jgi:hypothetical protein
MKKIITLTLICSALALSACAQKGAANYGYETQAPYGDSRTVGKAQAPMATHKAEKTFSSAQHK